MAFSRHEDAFNVIFSAKLACQRIFMKSEWKLAEFWKLTLDPSNLYRNPKALIGHFGQIFKIRSIFIFTSWKFTNRLILRWKWRWKHLYVPKTPFESFTENWTSNLKHPVLGGFRVLFELSFEERLKTCAD